ncbi:hypothetical protein LINPERHAP2_LOCUS35286 [Linum perenne]
MHLTRDIGRYLGVLVLNGRVAYDKYQDIMERINFKLSRWKAKALALTGRVTLALSVRQAIPAYAMQTCVLPIKIVMRLIIVFET